MTDILSSLAIFLAGAATSAALGYAAWRALTNSSNPERGRHPPAE